MEKFLVLSGLLFLFLSSLPGQEIQLESWQSLYITTLKDGSPVSTATGFIIKPRNKYYLVTNLHVVTNRDPFNGKWVGKEGVIPNQVHISHRNTAGINHSYGSIEQLKTAEGKNLYEEFSFEGKKVDIVAIPLKDTVSKDIKFYPIAYYNTIEQVDLIPADLLMVVGFPLGRSAAYKLPIWKSGTLSSEPILDQNGLPTLWLDMHGFEGMSGSPVYYITNNLNTKNGNLHYGHRYVFFVGVLSHINSDLDLGIVWKGTYLKTLFSSLE